jgi:putative ABC transport system permease protein
MKYLNLVFANLRRKKIRTGLTTASFMVALFLFGLLVAIHAAFYRGVDLTGADRLVVINRTSLIRPLPKSYREKLEQIAGVKQVTFASWFGGIYQDERNFFPQFAIDTDSYRSMFPEFVVPDEQWKAFIADREGAVVGQDTAKRFGWKIGDRIPLKGSIFPGLWEFNIRAIYTGTRAGDDLSQFWFHSKLFEEKVPRWFEGNVGWYTIRVTSTDQAVSVAKAVDKRFANSPFETKTETERAFASSFVKQMGNIEFLINAIGSVVFITLLLVTGNTMAIAVRERTGELAVLKTVGFSNWMVLLLILAESAVLAVIGGGLGVTIAKVIAPKLSNAIPGLIFYISPKSLAMGVGLALVVGLMAGIIPAVSAMRLRVVDALRRV